MNDSPSRLDNSSTAMTSLSSGQQRNQGEEYELQKLLHLITSSPKKQQLPSIDVETGEGISNPSLNPPLLSSEARSLEAFSARYKDERCFTGNGMAGMMEKVFVALVKCRLCNNGWTEHASSENRQRVMTVMRMLMRDPAFHRLFVVKLQALGTLCYELQRNTSQYLSGDDDMATTRILIETTNIIQKLSRTDEFRGLIVENGAHESLAKLLCCSDMTLLHCTLYALSDLAQSEMPRKCIGEVNVTERIVLILTEYDLDSKRHAAKLLKCLCGEVTVREELKVYDGIPLLLSLLSESDLKLLRHVIWCIHQMAEDAETCDDLRKSGVIPLLLNHLQDRKYSNNTDVTAPASATLGGRTCPLLCESTHDETMSSSTSSNKALPEEMLEQICLMKCACCAALTELIRNDHNSQQIVNNNGVYILAMLILPDQVRCKVTENLQKSAVRTLRFLFSLEGNRRKFRRLFQNSPSIFTAFIDIGHYVHNMDKYQAVVDLINTLPTDELTDLKETIDKSDTQREPSQFIEGYAVLEQLGSGAFGSVMKVRKGGQTLYALKEINLAAIGKTAREREKSMGEIVSEIDIVKNQMKHPNIVKYYRTFTVDMKLYVVMELIDGATIGEYFNSLKEKSGCFSEKRVWNIFIQIVLALRYLHKEKHIVHRDLTPNNIMLSDNDHVTITDFGLAKHKKLSDYLQSRVGTMLYFCPELIQDQPYGEKADIWAIGCILYQMCALCPPFPNSNMLALVNKIVSGKYDPLPEGTYSPKISQTIAQCLTVDPQRRPDISGLAGFIADELMLHMENSRHDNKVLEHKLAKERKRTQRHSSKANNYMQSYQKLFIASQEKYDKLASSQCSSTNGEFQLDLNNNGIETRGGISGDDEEEPSSSDSNNSAESLRIGFSRPPRPPSAPTRRKLDFNNNNITSHLEVQIPPVNKTSNRDSGISSAGEPSPNPDIKPINKISAANYHRSLSSPVVQSKKRQKSSSRYRPGSTSTGPGAATVSISPRKVRQINDPIQQILNVLHKIISITQLPPSSDRNIKRTIIERFKKSLFTPTTNSANLKAELKKLAQGSPELVDIPIGNVNLIGASLVNHNKTATTSGINHDTGLERDIAHGISYEQLLTIIEEVLHENGYYKMPQTSSGHQISSLAASRR